MEEKETFMCEELKESAINNFKVSFFYSLFYQLARFRYIGVSQNTYNIIMRECRGDSKLVQLSHLLENKFSASQIESQLSFSQKLTSGEFIHLFSKFTQINDLKNLYQLYRELTKKLQVAIRIIKYENDERKEELHYEDLNSNSILVTIVKKGSSQDPNYLKTKSSLEKAYDDGLKTEETLNYFPFTFNIKVCKDSYNLKSVNDTLLKSLTEQLNFIPVRKLEAVISAISSLKETKIRSKINQQYYDCTHSLNERFYMDCCRKKMCKKCIMESNSLKKVPTCFCNQRITDHILSKFKE